MFGVLEELGEIRAEHAGDVTERIRRVRSATVLRQVVNDILEWTQDLSGADLASVDAKLAGQGLPSLTLMRNVRDRRIVEIIERGQIRSAEEYRLLTERLADVANTGLPASLLDRAEQLLAGFNRDGTA
jgi:hypothetical protein